MVATPIDSPAAPAGSLPAPDRAHDLLLAAIERVVAVCLAHAAAGDDERALPRVEVTALAAQGLLRAPLAGAFGGLGLGFDMGTTRPLLHVLRRVGYGNLAVGRLYEGHVNALQLVQTYGHAAVVAQVAEDVTAGRMYGVWNTDAPEPVRFVEGQAGPRIAGAKAFASGAGLLAHALVTATRDDGSRQLCRVDLRQPRVQVVADSWQPLGMRASASGRIVFEDLPLRPVDLVGGPDDYIREPLFRAGAIRFAAVQAGGAESLLDAARTYLRDTPRPPDPLVEVHLAQSVLATERMQLWLRVAAEHHDAYLAQAAAGGAPPHAAAALIARANMVRAEVEQSCMTLLDHVERVVGARGLLRPWPLERIVRDLRLYLRQPAVDATLAAVGRYAQESGSSAADLWHAPDA